MSNNEKFEYQGSGEITAVYPYKDASGAVIFSKERWTPKAFSFSREINAEVVRKKGILKDVALVPYRLPLWKDKVEVIIAEGEKDADALAELGFASTSGPFGVDNWPAELNPWFKGKDVVIAYDVGEDAGAGKVAAALWGTAKTIQICSLPSDVYEFDISDLLAKYKDREGKLWAIRSLLEAAKPYAPPEILEVTNPPKPLKAADLDIDHEFLSLWTDSLGRVTDAPRIFALFAGLGVLSGVLNRHFFSYPRRINLNLYLLLLAPSTVCRKSVVLDIADDYLREVDPEIIFPESFTPEALLEFLRDHPAGLILWRELIQVSGFAFGQDYNRALPSVLTDLYDAKAHFRRLLKSEAPIEIIYPSISILAAGIQSWLISMMTGRENEFYGGLWTRFLLISAPDEPQRPFRLPARLVLLPNIIDRLRMLRAIKPRELMLDPILPYLKAWGEEHQRQALLIERPEMQASFMRFEVALIKVAGLLQLSTDPDSTAIEFPALDQAIKIIEYLKADLPRFFEEHVLFTEPERDQAAILRVIKKASPKAVLGSDLLKFARLPKKRRDAALAELLELARIEKVNAPSTAKGGRPGIAYRLFGEPE